MSLKYNKHIQVYFQNISPYLSNIQNVDIETFQKKQRFANYYSEKL